MPSPVSHGDRYRPTSASRFSNTIQQRCRRSDQAGCGRSSLEHRAQDYACPLSKQDRPHVADYTLENAFTWGVPLVGIADAARLDLLELPRACLRHCRLHVRALHGFAGITFRHHVHATLRQAMPSEHPPAIAQIVLRMNEKTADVRRHNLCMGPTDPSRCLTFRSGDKHALGVTPPGANSMAPRSKRHR